MRAFSKSIQYLVGGMIILFGFFIASFITAQTNTASTITFPVTELGNCANKEACKAYCDDPDHITACVEFASQHKLISKQEVQKAKKFAKAKQGPGGCKNMQECEAFCNDTSHIEACLEFAEQHELMDATELAEARKVSALVKKGEKLPGGCHDRQRCEEYCHMPEHIDECITFSEKAGLIPPEEVANARKMAEAMKAGHRLPGGCHDKKQCEEYCFEPTHMNECVVFAEASGLASGEELEHMKKVIPLMQRGEMPGGCRTKEQCEAYCKDESHFQECSDFAVKAGFMKPDEAERFRKTGGKGPGDCRGREECEAFCNNPDNQETCIQFAKEHDLIPEDQLEQAREGKERLQHGFQDAPGEVQECLRHTVGTELIEKMRSGQLMPGPQIGESVRRCFEEFGAKPQEGGEQNHQGTFQGPGGCKSPEECQAYCSDPTHAAECGNPPTSPRSEEQRGGSFLPYDGFLKEGVVEEGIHTLERKTQEFYHEGLPKEGFHLLEPSPTTQPYPYPKSPEPYQQPTSGTNHEPYSGGTTIEPLH